MNRRAMNRRRWSTHKRLGLANWVAVWGLGWLGLSLASLYAILGPNDLGPEALQTGLAIWLIVSLIWLGSTVVLMAYDWMS